MKLICCACVDTLHTVGRDPVAAGDFCGLGLVNRVLDF